MYIHKTGAFITEPVYDLKILKQEFADITGVNLRRINKFILLSLIGAYKCIGGMSPAKDTAIYLTTENGNLSGTEELLEQIFNKKNFPMPYSFINTMSNTASFYVAASLNFLGINLTVSSQNLSFERGLEIMKNDMEAGRTSAALIGGADDVVHAGWQYEEKFSEPVSSVKLIEGSSWFYFKTLEQGALARINANYFFDSYDKTVSFLREGDYSAPDVLSFGKAVTANERLELSKICPHKTEFDYVKEYGYFDSISAFSLSEFINGRPDGKRLLHINKNFTGNYAVLIAEKL